MSFKFYFSPLLLKINIPHYHQLMDGFRLMGLNATFNNISVISWQSVLLVEEIGEPGENHDLLQVTDKLLSHYIVSSSSHLRGVRTHNVNGDRH